MQRRDQHGTSGEAAGDRSRVPPRLRHLARLLDSAFRVPGTRWRVGFDGLLGLLPVAGDAVGLLLALWLVAEARRLGVPFGVLVRMLLNVLVDALVGSVPVAGDIFDFAFKANERNLRLLERHLDDGNDADDR